MQTTKIKNMQQRIRTPEYQKGRRAFKSNIKHYGWATSIQLFNLETMGGARNKPVKVQNFLLGAYSALLDHAKEIDERQEVEVIMPDKVSLAS